MLEHAGREVLAEYEFGQTLGCGTFGVTRLVTHRRTARPWACKTICKASIAASPAAVADVQHEVAILQHLAGHGGIVQLQGVYEDERSIHLVMELCTGGDLLDYISRFGRLSEGEAADIGRVMLTTLQHCHRNGVVHRDIKPENFLLGAPTLLMAPAGSAAAVLKVSDFGVSAFHTPGEHFSEIVGTPFYMAPEVLQRRYGPAADVWSVGVVIYLMIAGCLPFNGNSDRQIIKAVMDSEPDFAGEAWQGVSSCAREFVQLALTKDPLSRAGIAQLLAHPWMAGRGGSSKQPASSSGGTASAAAARQQQRMSLQQPQHKAAAAVRAALAAPSSCWQNQECRSRSSLEQRGKVPAQVRTAAASGALGGAAVPRLAVATGSKLGRVLVLQQA
ncbi:kinase-like domain-containing protein [Scenedesmus sp. NREL 46B-D3]|nr:kinase-like domain-containing protein [Scenedesmus sp. NREL 46B-D3]